MLQTNEIYTLDIHEQKIVELVAEMRQSNKEKTGWDGAGRVAEFGGVNLNVFGFGAEYIFCREKNTFPDFEIKNTSKRQKTDDYDCNWLSMSVDVKTSQKQFPLMVPSLTNAMLICLLFLFVKNIQTISSKDMQQTKCYFRNPI